MLPTALEFGGLQAANRKGRYDKEKLLWQFTVAIKSDPVGSAKEAQVAVAALQADPFDTTIFRLDKTLLYKFY